MKPRPDACVGIAVNPASGKDVRRLTARASVFDNQEKRNIVRRFLAGVVASGVRQVRYIADTHNIAASAVADVPDLDAAPVPGPATATALDTEAGATELQRAGCQVALTLGGDGTNRVFVKGWPDVTLLPLSTGTNNVFPLLSQATIAGIAAGLVARGDLGADTTHRVKTITIELPGGNTDLALIDAVLTSDRFVGARAVLDGTALRAACYAVAAPDAVGMSAFGGMLEPVGVMDDGGLFVEFGAGDAGSVSAAMAPGHFQTVGVERVQRLAEDEAVEFHGPGAIALDGEREHVLREGESATLRIARNGPRVIDIPATMAAAAANGRFSSLDREAPQTAALRGVGNGGRHAT